MFGVCEGPEQTDQSEAETPEAFRAVNVERREQHRQTSCGEVRPAPEQGQSLVKVTPLRRVRLMVRLKINRL